MRFDITWFKEPSIIYELGEKGSNSEIAAIEFKDKAYSSPEKDLSNSDATVTGDATDEILILDEKLNITVIRFHFHQDEGFPIGPFEVVQ